MNLPRRTGSTLGALAVLTALSLSACGSDSTAGQALETSAAAEPSDVAESTDATEATEEPTEEATDAEVPDDAAAAGDNPAWALPAVNPGELLTTIEAGDVSVDVYQVGTAKADDTGSFADPDTNKPLIAIGDTLVFVNYVITNNGAPIDLGSSLVTVSARYQDWSYLQGMDGLSGDELEQAQGVHDADLAPDGYNEAGIYTLGTGESYSYAENFEYQKSSPIDFTVEVLPVDAQGELLFDDKVEAEGSSTIV